MIHIFILITKLWLQARQERLIFGMSTFNFHMDSYSLTIVRVVITSNAFKSKMQPARHRMVYGLLKDEMAREGGIHALQLKTLTVEEEQRQRAREGGERDHMEKNAAESEGS